MGSVSPACRLGTRARNDEESWKLVAFIRHLPSLSPEEAQQMERMNPKAPDDRKEENEEDDFLGARSPDRRQAARINIEGDS